MTDIFDEFGPVLYDKAALVGIPKPRTKAVSITQEALEKNKQSLLVAPKTSPEVPQRVVEPVQQIKETVTAPKRRGRPAGFKRETKQNLNLSKEFETWLDDCKKIVLEGWNLSIKDRKGYYFVVMRKDGQERPFAFVEKKSGNIHCPAGDWPFEFVRGNIIDAETRLSDITPYGVKAFYTWHPTHPEFKASNIICNPESEEVE